MGENDVVPLQLLPMQKARLADAGLYYLKSDSIESFSQMDFVAAQAVARMVLRVADEQIQILENLTVGDFVVLSPGHGKCRVCALAEGVFVL